MSISLHQLHCQSQSPVLRLMFQLQWKNPHQSVIVLHLTFIVLGFVSCVLLVVIPVFRIEQIGTYCAFILTRLWHLAPFCSSQRLCFHVCGIRPNLL